MPDSQNQPTSRDDCRISANAVVVASRGDRLVDVEFEPRPQCAGCRGTCLWRRLQKARLDRLPVTGRLAPGTHVAVALSERRLLVASILLYGLPLAAILAGAAIGSVVSGSDIGTLGGVVLALAIVAAGFGRVRRRLERATLAELVVTPTSWSS